MAVRFNHRRVALLALAAAGMLAAVGLVVLYAQPAQANYPGTSGKIAYATPDANNTLQIHTITRNGDNNVKVTDNPLREEPGSGVAAGDERPAISPTGHKIVYQGWDGNDFEIYTAHLDGSDRKRVTDNNVRDENPYFSPDGQRIAYSSHHNGNFDIFTINLDGSDRFNVTNTTSSDERNPAYSPSGHKIAYSRRPLPHNDGNDWDIYTIDTIGLASSTKNITNDNTSNDEDPDWSPYASINGHRIAYSRFPLDDTDAEIYTIRHDGSGRMNVTNNNNSDDFWPSYSPGGNSIAYASGPRNGNADIFYIPKEGGERVLVTNTKTQNPSPYWGCEGECNKG
jgi:Tol biopolymer transport system component